MPSTTPGLNAVTLSASGAITALAPSANYSITIGSAGAFTIAAPTVDGIVLKFISTTAFAHTIVCTASLNGVTTNNRLTFTAAVGSCCEIVSAGGFWWAIVLTGVAVS